MRLMLYCPVGWGSKLTLLLRFCHVPGLGVQCVSDLLNQPSEKLKSCQTIAFITKPTVKPGVSSEFLDCTPLSKSVKETWCWKNSEQVNERTGGEQFIITCVHLCNDITAVPV